MLGEYLAVSFGSNGLYVSRSFGTIWTFQKSAPISYSVSMIGSGSVVVVGTTSGSIYYGESTTTGIVIIVDNNKL